MGGTGGADGLHPILVRTHSHPHGRADASMQTGSHLREREHFTPCNFKMDAILRVSHRRPNGHCLSICLLSSA